MPEKKRRPSHHMVLNPRHSDLIKNNPNLEIKLHGTDLSAEEVNLAKGVRILTDPKVTELFDEEYALSSDHIEMIFAINQQFSNIFGQLKSAYDLLEVEEDKTYSPAELAYLKKIFVIAAPMYGFLEKIRDNVYAYYEVAREADLKPDPDLLAKLEHEHLEFQTNFDDFETYIDNAAEVLGEEKPSLTKGKN
jgi:hypothetical protein